MPQYQLAPSFRAEAITFFLKVRGCGGRLDDVVRTHREGHVTRTHLLLSQDRLRKGLTQQQRQQQQQLHRLILRRTFLLIAFISLKKI